MFELCLVSDELLNEAVPAKVFGLEIAECAFYVVCSTVHVQHSTVLSALLVEDLLKRTLFHGPLCAVSVSRVVVSSFVVVVD